MLKYVIRIIKHRLAVKLIKYFVELSDLGVNLPNNDLTATALAFDESYTYEG